MKTECEPLSIFKTIQNDPKFSIFVEACTYIGLDKTLHSGGPYTLFIPDNEGFCKLSEDFVDHYYLPENRDKLLTLLTHHIIPVKLASSDLKSGKLRTLSGKKCEFNSFSGKLSIDQSIITHFDTECENGVVHIIERVIFLEI